MYHCAYTLGHPLPDRDDEPEKQNGNDWTWLNLFAVITMIAYLWTPKHDPIPEVSFPFFLQHMLYTGEVHVHYMYEFWCRVINVYHYEFLSCT